MEKILLLVFAPLAALVIILGWVVLFSRGKRTFHLQLKGLGLQIELKTDQNMENRNELPA